MRFKYIKRLKRSEQNDAHRERTDYQAAVNSQDSARTYKLLLAHGAIVSWMTLFDISILGISAPRRIVSI